MLIKSLKLLTFFFDIRLSSYVLSECFCQDLLENWFGGQRCSGSRKDNPSMADFGYNNNAIRNQKQSKPIANGNVADSGMIALTDEPFPCRKPLKNGSLNVNLE